MSEVRTVYEDDNFCVKIEESEGVLFVHCSVDRYSKSVKKKMAEVFEELKDAATFFGWEAIHSYTPNPKFAKLWEGGFKINEFEYMGKPYEVIRWEL